MKLTRRILTVLLALVVTLAFMPAACFAAGYEDDDSDGIVLNKYYTKTDNHSGTLTLEAYITGTQTVVKKNIPSDIILVLDVSGSMITNNIAGKSSYAARSSQGYSYSGYGSSNYYYLDGGNYYKVSIGSTSGSSTGYTRTTVSGGLNSQNFKSNTYYCLYNNAYYLIQKDSSNYLFIKVGNTTYYLNGNSISTQKPSGQSGPSGQKGQGGQTNVSYTGAIYTKTSTTTYYYMYYTKNNVKYYLSGTGVTTKQPTNVTATGTTIWTGVLYSATEADSVTRLEALRTAANSFVESVASDAAAKNLDHRISIVKFSGDKLEDGDIGKGTSVAESNLYQNIGDDAYVSNGYNVNYSQIVMDMTSVSGNKDSIESKISTLGDCAFKASNPAGGTAADLGLKQALREIKNSSDSTDRNKVVIVFTDGEPTGSTGYNSFDTTVANGAIDAANTIKNTYGASVYTVGVFSDDDANSTDVNTYMNYLSSNYPSAASMTSGGSSADSKYYVQVSNSNELIQAFQDIMIDSTEETVSVDVSEVSILQDEMSEYFDIPDGTDVSDVKIYTADCTGADSSGTLIFDDRTALDGCTVNLDTDSDKIQVSGFDFKENWCGYRETDSAYSGKKLIVEFPIEENGTGIGNQLTNTTDTSGIYKDSDALAAGQLTDKFQSPEVYIPYFTVYHQTGEDRAAGTAGEKQDINIKAAENSTYEDGTDSERTVFDVTAGSYNYKFEDEYDEDIYPGLTGGNIYGGIYTDAACTTAITDECGKELSLEAADNEITLDSEGKLTSGQPKVYYVKEVDEKYLQPKQLTLLANSEIKSTYFLTTVDDLNYNEVGFDVTDKSSASSFKTVAGSGSSKLTVSDGEISECAVTNKLTATLTSGQNVEITMSNMIDANHSGYVAVSGLTYDNANSNYNSAQGKIGAGSYTVIPYWITPDGVKVTSIKNRTLEYSTGNLDYKAGSTADQTLTGETSNTNPKTTSNVTVKSVTSKAVNTPVVTLALVNTLTATGTDGNSSLEGDELLAGTVDTSVAKAVTVTAPAKVTLKSVKAGKKSLTVSWKKVKNAKGYQIKYKKNGTDTWKYVYVKSSVTSKKISKLAAGKKYTVKVRAYKTYTNEDGKTCKKFGKYSSVKTVKTLK